MNKLWNLRDRAGRRKVVEKNTKAQDYWFQKHLFYFKVSRHYFRREREHTVFRLWHEAAFPSNHWWMDLERFSLSLSHPPRVCRRGVFTHSCTARGIWDPGLHWTVWLLQAISQMLPSSLVALTSSSLPCSASWCFSISSSPGCCASDAVPC